MTLGALLCLKGFSRNISAKGHGGNVWAGIHSFGKVFLSRVRATGCFQGKRQKVEASAHQLVSSSTCSNEMVKARACNRNRRKRAYSDLAHLVCCTDIRAVTTTEADSRYPGADLP